MLKIVKVKFSDYYESVKCYIDLPGVCPHCGTLISPQIMFGSPFATGYFKTDSANSRVVIIYRCTNDKCLKFFVIEYKFRKITHLEGYNQVRTFDYLDCEPIKYSYKIPFQIDVPKNIKDIFPEFFNIYSQAQQAEKDKLDKIYGMAYRKALEFLVKGYAIHRNPNDVSKINAKPLGNVIAQDFGDLPRIQALAKASNWIATDATHYEQRFDNADTEAMKMFIESAMTFISADLTADEASKFIEENDPKK